MGNVPGRPSLFAKPQFNETTEIGSSEFDVGPQLEYAMALAQGFRRTMEDAAVVELGVPEQRNLSYFAIFDGHGHSAVAEFAAARLLDKIRSTKAYQAMLTEDGLCDIKAANMVEALPTAFAELDEEIREMSPVERPVFPSRIPSMPSLKIKRPGTSSKASGKVTGGGEADLHTRLVTSDEMGSTATLVLITPLQFYFCNCGDSRAILVSDGKITFRTKDHTPDIPSERKRVEASGGRVLDKRVDGLLAVSRALGDFHFKSDRGSHRHEQKVISKPDVSVIPRNHRTNEYIVLASDGLWGTIGDDEVQAVVSARLAQGMSVGLCCDELIKMAIKRGSMDNVAIVILRFEKPESF